MQPQPPDLQAEFARWEAILAAEGMPAEPRLTALASGSHRQVKKARLALERATEPLPYHRPSRTKQEAAREALEPLLGLLPPTWRQTFHLRWQGLTQDEIARRLGLTQASVSYHLRTGTRRMQERKALADLDQVIDRIKGLLPDLRPEVITTLRVYLTSISQVEAARHLDCNQSTVSLRVRTTIAHLRRVAPEDEVTQLLIATLRHSSRVPEPAPPTGPRPRPRKAPPPGGYWKGSCKLLPEQVRDIRRRAAQGEAPKSIVEDYPVAISAIHRIIRRATYSWLS